MLYVFQFSLDCFVHVLFAFVVLGLVFSVLCPDIVGRRLQNYLFKFCIKWDVIESISRLFSLLRPFLLAPCFCRPLCTFI